MVKSSTPDINHSQHRSSKVSVGNAGQRCKRAGTRALGSVIGVGQAAIKDGKRVACVTESYQGLPNHQERVSEVLLQFVLKR
jgi:hypothetical protein